jgi:hypothetical protein
MRTDPDENGAELEHRLAVIAEYGDWVLRVVVNTKAFPMRNVTAYFDRAENNVVGIEMLYLSKRTPKLNTQKLEFETV